MGPLIGRLQGGGATGLVMALVAAGALLPLLGPSAVLALTSAVLFGVSFLAVVAAVTQAARDALPSAQWTAAVAILTTGFALGQCIGPVLSGLLADTADGVRSGMLLSVAVLVLASAVALTHRTRPDAMPRGS
jgi:MFS family permease